MRLVLSHKLRVEVHGVHFSDYGLDLGLGCLRAGFYFVGLELFLVGSYKVVVGRGGD